MRAYILAREDAIAHWRELMGPTKVFRARYTSPTTIRAQFGLTDTRNTTHGSGKAHDDVHDLGIPQPENKGENQHVVSRVLQVPSVTFISFQWQLWVQT